MLLEFMARSDPRGAPKMVARKGGIYLVRVPKLGHGDHVERVVDKRTLRIPPERD
eukprot:COSAG02_NODE_15163_length_1198_cov_0.967243_3_plen_54_part_01